MSFWTSQNFIGSDLTSLVHVGGVSFPKWVVRKLSLTYNVCIWMPLYRVCLYVRVSDVFLLMQWILSLYHHVFCIFGTDPYSVIFIILFFFLFVVNGSTAYHSKLLLFPPTLIILSVQWPDQDCYYCHCRMRPSIIFMFLQYFCCVIMSFCFLPWMTCMYVLCISLSTACIE